MGSFHLCRTLLWLILAPVVLLTPLKDQVWVVVALSLYANFSGDFGAYQAARAERKR